LRWCFDHAETITDQQLQRVKNLGGGIAVQFRMYFQGELFKNLYGEPQSQLPPIRKMLQMKIPVGLGTDATRISTFNPWMSIHWAITGKTIGGYQFWPAKDALTKFEALQLYTVGSSWISGEENLKGRIEKGQYADMVILNKDYFSITTDEVRDIHALVTVVNGKVVYAEGTYKDLAPPLPEMIPAWSPVKFYGGYQSK
jgi:predicted amidohydrolase YtcJ